MRGWKRGCRGWVGFDPTNNLLAGARHIRVAVGRDYADVPPTRGVFKGIAKSMLHVAVRVASAEGESVDTRMPPAPRGVPWVPKSKSDQQQQ